VGRTVRSVLAATALSTVIGCGLINDPSAVCEQQAAERGRDFTVAAAYETSAGRIRELFPFVRDQLPQGDPLPSDETAVVLCYLDGSITTVPNGGPSLEREVIVVVNGTAVSIAAGSKEGVEILDPSR
jgi:hypothetical protein